MSVCPVCDNSAFDQFGTRPTARCTACGALERGRLAWLVLKHFDLLRSDIRILNIAPEPFMLFHGRKTFGDNYIPCDFSPENFAKWKIDIGRIDLCSNHADHDDASFDVIMHNHVLEHVPCEVSPAITRLNRLLKPGGYHLLSVPVRPNSDTERDLNPALSPEERTRRFGQDDHMRIFGDRDLIDILRAGGLDPLVDLEAQFPPEVLRQSEIPEQTLQSINGHRVFVWRKPARRERQRRKRAS